MRDALDAMHAGTPVIPSRRGLLARGTAALLTGTAIATVAHAAPVASLLAAGADAELLRLCARQEEAWAVVLSVMNEKLPSGAPRGTTPWSEDKEQKLAVAKNEYTVLVEEIAETPATTPAGLRAKARVLRSFLERIVVAGVDANSHDDIALGERGQTEHRMALSIVRDVLAGRAVA